MYRQRKQTTENLEVTKPPGKRHTHTEDVTYRVSGGADDDDRNATANAREDHDVKIAP
jgi:hypothetical protein